LGAVYKIVSIEDESRNMRDTIKLSSNAEKVSTPGKKQVWRITSKEKGKSEGDFITFADTDVTHLDSIYMFHPTYTYINKTIENFEARPLLVPIFENGKQVYELPSLAEIQDYANQEIEKLWDEYKRVLNPQLYPVDLAQDVWDNKMKLINSIRQQSQAKAI
jgi:nicotinate phosphoribosyltransferase